jgi:predicted nucleic acid-binding protein
VIFVADASPIISFARAERLALLWQVVRELWIPDAVFQELTIEGKPGAAEVTRVRWVRRKTVVRKERVEALPRKLGRGEREAIILAEESQGVLLVDEPSARQEAARRNLTLLGSLGILREAKLQGIIQEVKSHLDALRDAGFRISDELYQRFLREMGEV